MTGCPPLPLAMLLSWEKNPKLKLKLHCSPRVYSHFVFVASLPLPFRGATIAIWSPCQKSKYRKLKTENREKHSERGLLNQNRVHTHISVCHFRLLFCRFYAPKPRWNGSPRSNSNMVPKSPDWQGITTFLWTSFCVCATRWQCWPWWWCCCCWLRLHRWWLDLQPARHP